MTNNFDWLSGALAPNGVQQPDVQEEVFDNADQDAALKAARDAEYNERKILARWCVEGMGPAALDQLKAATVEKPLISGDGPMIAALSIGLTPEQWAFFRDGQNTIWHFLMENMKWCNEYEKEINDGGLD